MAQAEQYKARETARIDSIHKEISDAWVMVRKLRYDRSVINNQISKYAALARRLTTRTAIRDGKLIFINRAISRRKALLKARQERAVADRAAKAAISEWRKKQGVPIVGGWANFKRENPHEE